MGSIIPFKIDVTGLKLSLKTGVMGSRLPLLINLPKLPLKLQARRTKLPILLELDAKGPNVGLKSASRCKKFVNRGIESVNHGVGMNRGVGIVNRGIGSSNRGVGITKGVGIRIFPRYMSSSGKPPKENGEKDELGKKGSSDINPNKGRVEGDGRMDGGSGRVDDSKGWVDLSSGRTENLGSETMNKFSREKLNDFSQDTNNKFSREKLDSFSQDTKNKFSHEKLDSFSQDRIDRFGEFSSDEKMKNFSDREMGNLGSNKEMGNLGSNREMGNLGSDREMGNLKSGGLENVGDLNISTSNGKIDSASNVDLNTSTSSGKTDKFDSANNVDLNMGTSNGKFDSASNVDLNTSTSSGKIDSANNVDLNMNTSSGKIDSTGNGRIDRWINYIQEKRPEVYSFGQKLSEKSSVLKNSVTSASVDKTATDKKPEDWNDILNRWYQQYQDFVGITDLKKAQDRVTELSETLLETQGRRRSLQAETEDLQEGLVANHQRITKTEQYSQEHFTLFDQAREMNDRLKVVRAEFLQCERTERDTFTQLSAAIRDCHERERMQAEQSKYWSIIASVVSAALASIITSVNNWVRIREIKDHVTTNNNSLLDGYRQMHQDVMQVVKGAEVVNEEGKVVRQVVKSSEAFNEAGKVGMQVVKSSEAFNDAGKVVKLSEAVNEEGKVVKGAELTQGASVLGEGDLGVLESTSGVSQTTPGHPSLAPADISHISKELLGEISQTLAKDRDRLRELLMEHLGKVVGLAGRGELTREATEDMILDLQTQDRKEMKTGGIIYTDKPPPAHDLTLETAQALGSAIALDSAIPGASAEKPTSEYTYRHIASAMAVGAGIGTLATACIMKSLGGG